MRKILLFDGYCYLCQSSVQFIIKYEKTKKIYFVPLQSNLGKKLLRDHGLDENYSESIVFIENDICYKKSDAVIAIACHLTIPWKFVKIFKWIPKKISYYVYDFIAINREKWFGKDNICMVPSKELRSRFLDGS